MRQLTTATGVGSSPYEAHDQVKTTGLRPLLSSKPPLFDLLGRDDGTRTVQSWEDGLDGSREANKA